MSDSKTIGIVGGMGPEATVEFMSRIVRNTPAQDDEDHLRMLVDNNPKVPSRIKALIERTGSDPLPVLVGMAQGLQAAGADFLVMPCNTAHHYHAALAGAVTIPFLSIVDITLKCLATDWPEARRIGFLASPAVQIVRVFDDRLEAAGLLPVHPEAAEAEQLLQLIRDVKRGLTGTQQAAGFADLAKALMPRADLLLIACTELSMLEMPQLGDFPVIDTLDLLVDATIATAKG
ncbi:MAG TPA: amino acid racemase [Devosiaceae bacterium]